MKTLKISEVDSIIWKQSKIENVGLNYFRKGMEEQNNTKRKLHELNRFKCKWETLKTDAIQFIKDICDKHDTEIKKQHKEAPFSCLAVRIALKHWG